ncbi:MAG: HD domain-containing protein [Nitrospirae bacterium]|nr:HD domain-containing protein [Nitrospirota bacterium]
MLDPKPSGPASEDEDGRREPAREAPVRDSQDAPERFLRAIGKVLRDRALYPEHHPQALAGMSALGDAIAPLFAERSERTVVVIDDQVFVDDRLLGQGKSSAELARTLHERGIEVLTAQRGLTLDELRPFLDLLVGFRAGTSKPCFRSPHLVLGDVAIAAAGTAVPDAVQHLGAAVATSALRSASFEDEAKLLRDTYVDWAAVQERLLSQVDRIMSALEKNLFANVHSLIPLAELKSYDEYTYVHAINLSILTMVQAESLGFPKEAVHAFGVGALLHDVGKTQVPVDVLHKAGKLSPEEFELMKGHPAHGAALLLQHPGIPKIAAIVAYEHHLKFNHAGYPSMTRQRPQHIASRLTAISDTFDAMRSNRPYRDAMEAAQIFEIMQGNKGTDLDPTLVDHFFALMKSRKVV